MKPYLYGIGIRYFAEVARTGSLTIAAETLHVAVSAISRQIKKLEDELQCELFERMPRGMVLTTGGRKLLDYANRSFLDAEQVANELLGMDLLRTGTIRLACTQGFAYGFIPSTITNFREQYPRIKFQLFVGSPKVVSQRIREGESDVALTFSLSPSPGIHIKHRAPAPIHVLVGTGDPLAKKRSLFLQDLNGRQVVLPEVGTTLRDLIDIAATLADVEFEAIVESNNSYALYMLAKHSGALMFSAPLSVAGRFEEDSFVAIPLKDEVLHQRNFQIETMAGRTLPTLVDAFCEHLKLDTQKLSFRKMR